MIFCSFPSDFRYLGKPYCNQPDLLFCTICSSTPNVPKWGGGPTLRGCISKSYWPLTLIFFVSNTQYIEIELRKRHFRHLFYARTDKVNVKNAAGARLCASSRVLCVACSMVARKRAPKGSLNCCFALGRASARKSSSEQSVVLCGKRNPLRETERHVTRVASHKCIVAPLSC